MAVQRLFLISFCFVSLFAPSRLCLPAAGTARDFYVGIQAHRETRCRLAQGLNATAAQRYNTRGITAP
jgi:hypothetical protein